MKTSKNYIIIHSLIIALTSTFAVFILLFEFSDPNFPFWITLLSLFFLVISVVSFIWNFQKLEIGEEEIRLKRLFRPDLILPFSEIDSIEENTFYYRGQSPSSIAYTGHFLTVKTKTKKYRVSSLNEPEYGSIRQILKNKLGKKVLLLGEFHAGRLNWFVLGIMIIPIIYLIVQTLVMIK
jgi:hypothetical protein